MWEEANMTTSMFGAPLGFQTYDHDQAALALQAAQTAHQRSLTGMNMAQTDTMLRKQANEDRLMQALAAGNQPGGQVGGQVEGQPQQLGDEGGYTLNGESPLKQAPTFEQLSTRLRRAAGIYEAVGKTESAGKIAVQAARLHHELGGADAQLAARQGHQITNEIKQIRLIQETLTGVTSPATYDTARLMLQANPLTADESRSLPPQYDPAKISAFLAGSPALIKQRELALKATDEERKKRDDASKAALRVIQGNATEGRLKVAQDRADLLAKNGDKAGGKPQGPATPGDLLSMKNQIRSMGFEFDPDQARAAIDSITEDARVIWKRNPAIAPPAAEAMAIQSSIDRGELTPANKVAGFKMGSDTFASTAGSPARPIPSPAKRDSYKKGHFYQDPDGTLYQYLGGSQRKIIHGKSKLPVVQGGDLAEEE
jgi:hypothetical protein